MRRRIVVVEKEKCNPSGCGGYLCMRVSPSNKMGKEAFVKDTDGKIRVNEEVVTDADAIAVNKCPFKALKMVRLPEELNKEPIHRYGSNGFALYNLPVPQPGKVVGIIGRNGIGKSTAIKILAGTLKPNLGSLNGVSDKEIISYFKGTEAQAYFERLLGKGIRVSYKPQQIEQLPKQYSGKIKDLLMRVNEKKDSFDKIIDELDIRHLLNRDLGVISGGELQRVAIAAAALKEADVYFFDEPTSYMDIKQRLKISQFIKSLATNNVSVVVVEHDLIILDYMSEQVNILYGQEGAYGIVSQPKSAKSGINTYLSGYIRDENVRFRDKPIIFTKRPPINDNIEEELASWPEIKVSIGDFKLDAAPGIIRKHDIIGVLGENGIGKTTFVKELVRIRGKTKRGELKISYKPQYLEGSDELVATYLKPTMKYKNQIIDPLDLERLFDRQLNQLSGGQLQRVFIAKALSEEADLFLFDEPSAYLDVEQRLLISKIIKDMMVLKGKAAIIVDHDLLFIDYLSTRLIVFEGRPGFEGRAKGPYDMSVGMNMFLKDLGVTFRRDDETNRPRANKKESQKDREQKVSGKLYYS